MIILIQDLHLIEPKMFQTYNFSFLGIAKYFSLQEIKLHQSNMQTTINAKIYLKHHKYMITFCLYKVLLYVHIW